MNPNAQEGSLCFAKIGGLKRSLQNMESYGYPMGEIISGENLMKMIEVKSWSISGYEGGFPLTWESQIAIIEKLISTFGIDRVIA